MAWKHLKKHLNIGGDAYETRHWPQEIVHYANTYGQDKFIFVRTGRWSIPNSNVWPTSSKLDFVPCHSENHARQRMARVKLDEKLKLGASSVRGRLNKAAGGGRS